jgi:hypothetical protein
MFYVDTDWDDLETAERDTVEDLKRLVEDN